MSANADERGQRIQKVLAMAGIGSRRECEELILEGRVEVDRKVVTELGARIDPETSELRLDGENVRIPRMIYVMVNKPTGVVTTNWDPEGRPRVIDLVRTDYRLFPVGRLDRTSEGLILLTNDGELANQLTHPRYGVSKTYHAVVAGHPRHDELQVLCRGVHLAEGLAKAESVVVKKRVRHTSILEIVLREGKNREVRRLLARVGHKVVRLKRVAQGPVRLGDLPVGESRPLTLEEVAALRRACRAPRGVGSSGSRSSKRDAQRGQQGERGAGGGRGHAQRKATARQGKQAYNRTPGDERPEGSKGTRSRISDATERPVTPPDWASTLGAILDYESQDSAGESQGQSREGRADDAGGRRSAKGSRRTGDGNQRSRAAGARRGGKGRVVSKSEARGGSKATGRKATGSKATGSRATGSKATGSKATGSKATGSRATGSRATGSKATGSKATGSKATGRKATGRKATGGRATGSKATGSRATGSRATGSRASSKSPSGKKSGAKHRQKGR